LLSMGVTGARYGQRASDIVRNRFYGTP